MYKSIEGYISQVTRMDGHACLLRAMCEASAYPLHDEGLEMLSTSSSSLTLLLKKLKQLKHYVAAQAKGM